MIIHKYKSIFVHIPKVAGQSIESFFLADHGLNWDKRAPMLMIENENPELGPPRLAHLMASEYCKYQYISEDQFNDYFKFAFVRNPWSRAVSLYKHSKYNLVMSFKRFVQFELPKLIKEQQWFFGQQYDFVHSDNELMVDFIGRFENLDEDFMQVTKSLNISNAKLTHTNESKNKKFGSNIQQTVVELIRNPRFVLRYSPDRVKSKDYRDYYDTHTIQAINELYSKDINAFDYSFDTARAGARHD